MSDEQPVATEERSEPSTTCPDTGKQTYLASGWPTGLTFALIAGLIAWGLFLRFYPIFTVPSELTDIDMPNSQQTAALRAAEKKVALTNALAVLAWTGALLAAAMAIGEAWARRSWLVATVGFLAAAVFGALFGGAAAWLGHVIYYLLLIPFEGTTSLQGTVVVQIAMLGVLGGGVGLTVGSLAGFSRSTFGYLLGGAVAGALGGMIYPVAVAFLVPAAHTDYVIPRDAAGALPWLLITALFVGIIVPQMNKGRSSQPETDVQTEHPMSDESAQPA